MIPGDLTTLANVKTWLNIQATQTASDPLLTRMISAVSQFIQQAMINRTIASQPYYELRDGSKGGRGLNEMTFGYGPVSSVTSLTIYGTAVTASSDGGVRQAGYGFDANQIWLPYGSCQQFCGRRTIALRYVGGFLVLPDTVMIPGSDWLLPAEVRTVPAATPYEITPYRTWLADNVVNFTGGAALTKVPSAPATGEYAVDLNGVYTFAAADSAKSVSLSYSYCPADLEQSVIEVLGIRFKEMDRIGQVSKMVGTESVTFSQKDIPDDVRSDINNYKRTFAF